MRPIKFRVFARNLRAFALDNRYHQIITGEASAVLAFALVASGQWSVKVIARHWRRSV